MPETTHVVKVDAYVEHSCEHCSYFLRSSTHFADAVNHYIDEHGYAVLHVGMETRRLDEPDLAFGHFTVAVLAK